MKNPPLGGFSFGLPAFQAGNAATGAGAFHRGILW